MLMPWGLLPSDRFPLKGSFKGDIDIDVCIDIDSDIAVSISCGVL